MVKKLFSILKLSKSFQSQNYFTFTTGNGCEFELNCYRFKATSLCHEKTNKKSVADFAISRQNRDWKQTLTETCIQTAIESREHINVWNKKGSCTNLLENGLRQKIN